ncbi:MAG TPA: ABC transporter permease, partial [Terriglobia bacterium]|nr:ABC transporter permease [Terriglobia bacterium]
KGADTEMTSGLEGTEVRIIRDAPGIRHDGDTPLASAELSVVIDLPKKSKPDWTANVPMRGIQPVTPMVRHEMKMIEGRMLRFGSDEAIVGKGAKAQFVGLNVGNTIVSGQNRWTVVGVFEAAGGIAESEIWCDVQNLQSVYRRTNGFSVMLAELDSPESFVTLSDWLMKNPQVQVDAHRENEYYASQSTTMTSIIDTLGFGIASLMAIGAVFGAILTMYTAVASRSREIATLRALGFNTLSVIVSVLAESVVLGGIGGLLGAVVAFAAFDGFQTSTMNFQTFSQVAFAFRVTPTLFITGLIYALSIGLIGGLLPAIRAARLPITKALREL